MKRRACFLLASLLFGCACNSIVTGAIVQAPPSSGELGVPCRNQEFAAFLGDTVALLWAARLTTHWAVPYEDSSRAAVGREVCIVDRGKHTMCGDIRAVGCASRGGWMWSATSDSLPATVDVFVHEFAHLVGFSLGIPTSGAHTEHIHKMLEPLVAADARAIKWPDMSMTTQSP